jgi:hypothetical protein
MSDQNNEVEVSSDEIERIKTATANAVTAFLEDPRHDLYKATENNRKVIWDYLCEKESETNAETLHAAYEHLKNEEKLDVFEESNLPVVQKVQREDFGPVASLEEQQAARRNIPVTATGVPNSNRDAFITKAQRTAPEKYSGGRIHL